MQFFLACAMFQWEDSKFFKSKENISIFSTIKSTSRRCTESE